MTPFKRSQHKLILVLAPALTIFISVTFLPRFVAYLSPLQYVEGNITQCQHRSNTDGTQIYLSIDAETYHYTRPVQAYEKIKTLCNSHEYIGIYYHNISDLLRETSELKVREILITEQNKIIFSREHYYNYEKYQSLSAISLAAIFFIASIYSALAVFGKIDDRSIASYKQEYKKTRGIIYVRRGDDPDEALFMVMVTFGAGIFIIYQTITSDFRWAYLLMAPLPLFGYPYLVGLVNRRRIYIEHGLLKVRKGPLPQLNKNINLEISTIKKIHCDYEINSSPHGKYENISVVAMLKNDNNLENGQVILFFTSTYEEARAITDILNNWLVCR